MSANTQVRTLRLPGSQRSTTFARDSFVALGVMKRNWTQTSGERDMRHGKREFGPELQSVLLVTLILCLHGRSPEARAQQPEVEDTSPHTARLIETDVGVFIEVLDWEGNGPPLVLLARA
jgi:hypothetical protein